MCGRETVIEIQEVVFHQALPHYGEAFYIVNICRPLKGNVIRRDSGASPSFLRGEPIYMCSTIFILMTHG